MKQENMERAIIDAVRDADLRPEQIPSIDLYLDQVMSLMEEKHKESSERFSDRVLTKTMVNNYSKDGLISPVKGKKYSKEQILQMLLVYNMKNTLSIGQIKEALQRLYELDNYDAHLLEKLYTRFLSTKEMQREEMSALLEQVVEREGLNLADHEDFFLLVLGISSLSSYLKNTAEALLEGWYDELATEKEEREQARRDEQKRQKQEKKAAKASKKAEKETTEVAVEAMNEEAAVAGESEENEA